jgi:hypothetical protein
LYLGSAALLLYGFYLVSCDPTFLHTEVAQLSFNLSSLQLYEALVVATAIFLAGRAVWYDSTLLVGLENLLLLVPFILISQAALIEQRLVWILCLAGGCLAAIRLLCLERFIAPLNFPRRLAGASALVLATNMALPIVYRILHESKIGTKPDWGAAYQTNQYVWWLLIPALCAASTALPLARSRGEDWPQRVWLPLGCFSLWVVGTGVHLYCLGYVYDFDLRPELLAPALWMLFWVLSLRVTLLLPGPAAWKNALWILPMLATLLAAPQNGKQVFLALTALNMGIFAFLYFRQRAPFALHLLLISVVALAGGLPEEWGRSLAAGFSREKVVGAGAGLYFLLCTVLSRQPRVGLLGAIIAATMVSALGEHPLALHWAAQIGLAFLLLHSLRWTAPFEEGAGVLRWLAALGWIGHSFVWTHIYGGGWAPCAVALPVLCLFLAARWVQGQWGSVAIPLGAVLALLSPTSHSAAVQIHSAPPGLLAVLGSFALFGLGTLAAVTKHRWASR